MTYFNRKIGVWIYWKPSFFGHESYETTSRNSETQFLCVFEPLDTSFFWGALTIGRPCCAFYTWSVCCARPSWTNGARIVGLGHGPGAGPVCIHFRLVGGDWLPSILYFPIHIGFLPSSSQLSFIFFRLGFFPNHQPVDDLDGDAIHEINDEKDHPYGFFGHRQMEKRTFISVTINISTCGGVLKWVYPPNHPFIDEDVPL